MERADGTVKPLVMLYSFMLASSTSYLNFELPYHWRLLSMRSATADGCLEIDYIDWQGQGSSSQAASAKSAQEYICHPS